MGMPGYFNPYMAMQGPGMMQMGMPHPNMGPPNPVEAAAAHGFSSPPPFRPPPIDAARARSLNSPQTSPLSPTGKLSFHPHYLTPEMFASQIILNSIQQPISRPRSVSVWSARPPLPPLQPHLTRCPVKSHELS